MRHATSRTILFSLPCSLVLFLLSWLILAHPVAAQDIIDPPDGDFAPLVWPLETDASDNNELIWRRIIGSGCISSDHFYTITVPIDPAPLNDIRLSMVNFDVDYNRPCENPGLNPGPEVDKTYINGSFLGTLVGSNNGWSVNEWELATTQVQQGVNEILIDTDSTNTGCWCVGVGWIEIRARPAFIVEQHWPAPSELNRRFKQNEVDLSVQFSDAYDPATVNENTFQLAYRNTAGAWVQVTGGTFIQHSAEHVEYVPPGDLKDGVRYRVLVKAGEGGVKSINGADLEAGAVWTFWTAPDLDLVDPFDYGSGTLCSPAGSPCSGLEITYFQTSRNMRLIEGKPAIARIYLRWRTHNNVFPADLRTLLRVRISFNDGSATASKTVFVQRPDQYSATARMRGLNTIYFRFTPTGTPRPLTFSVEVEPTPQQNTTTLVFNSSTSTVLLGPTTALRIPRYYVRDGDHDGGIPAAFQTSTNALVARSEPVIVDEMPYSSAAIFPAGYMDLGYTPTAVLSTRVPNCAGTSRVVENCPFMAAGVSEMSCITSHLIDRLYGRPVASVFPAASVCPAGIRGYHNGGALLVFPPAGDDTIAHEVGHHLGLADIDAALLPGLRTSLEGFSLRRFLNYSAAENLANITPLMASGGIAPAPYLRWIHQSNYERILTSFFGAPRLRADDGQLWLIVTGYVDPQTSSAFLTPPRHQPVPNKPVSSQGPCSARLLDNQNQILIESFFHPGLGDVHQPGSPPDDPTQRPVLEGHFSESLPWNNGAAKLQVQCGGTLLAERARTFQLPSVAFTQPAAGAVLSGEQTISWVGQDAEGDSLHYQLLLDGGDARGTFALTGVQPESSFTLDTSELASDDGQQLRLVVTDGFNSVQVVRDVTISNPLRVLAVEPADGETNVDLQHSIEASFYSRLRRSSVDEESFTLERIDVRAGPVQGEVDYSDDSSRAHFIPAEPLAPNSRYRATLTTGLRDRLDNTLPADVSWEFTTASDGEAPRVARIFPPPGAVDQPVKSIVQIVFSELMDESTLTSANIKLFQSNDAIVPKTLQISQENGQTIVRLADDPTLTPDQTKYRLRLESDIKDQAGNPLEGPFESIFWTEASAAPVAGTGLRILGYRDEGNNTERDERFETLTVYVDTEVLVPGSYGATAELLSRTGETIGWSETLTRSLGVGIHALPFVFDGEALRNLGGSGPYRFDALFIYDVTDLNRFVRNENPFFTGGYRATDFASDLVFSDLPDQILTDDGGRENAFSLRDFTQHRYRPIEDVTYEVFYNSEPLLPVTIDAENNLDIGAPLGPVSSALIWLQARDPDGHRVVAPFHIHIETPRATAISLDYRPTMEPGEEQTIQVSILDQVGRPFTQALPISASTSLGEILPSETTTVDGMATFTLRAGENRGTARVTFGVGSGAGRVDRVVEIRIGSGFYLPLIRR